MSDFSYKALPWNIVFGVGALARLSDEVTRLGYSRGLVLVTPNQTETADAIAKQLGAVCVGIFDNAQMHVPIEVVEQAAAEAARLNADCTVAIGGGSTTGLGKALALKEDIDNIAIPTSYAGSEMTNIWGITENGKKVTGRDNKVVPNLTIYDPNLTLSLPAKFAAASGLNAMAQAVVNVATGVGNPIVEVTSVEAIRLLSHGLPSLLANPDDISARSDILLGACLAAAALGTGTTSLHHKLCHTFGGTLNTPHAETHAILLPHSVAYNSRAIPRDTQRVAEAMGVEDASLGLFELAKSLDIPTSLASIGVTESDLDSVAEIVAAADFHNPEPVTAPRIRQLLDNAFHGRPPTPIATQ